MSKKITSIITGTLAAVGAVAIVGTILYKKGYLKIEVDKSGDKNDSNSDDKTDNESNIQSNKGTKSKKKSVASKSAKKAQEEEK